MRAQSREKTVIQQTIKYYIKKTRRASRETRCYRAKTGNIITRTFSNRSIFTTYRRNILRHNFKYKFKYIFLAFAFVFFFLPRNGANAFFLYVSLSLCPIHCKCFVKCSCMYKYYDATVAWLTITTCHT